MYNKIFLLLGALLDVLNEPGLLVWSVGLLGVDEDLAHSRQTQGGHGASFTRASTKVAKDYAMFYNHGGPSPG